MRSTLFAIFLLTNTYQLLNAQTGGVEGTIKTPFNNQLEAVEGVQILIPSLQKGTLSDSLGYFRLAAIPPGDYTLSFSYLGYKPFQKNIQIADSLFELDPILLSIDSIQLATVEIQGEIIMNEIGALIQQKQSDQHTQIISSDQIEQLPEANLGEALQRMSAVNLEKQQGEGKYVSIRGTPRSWSAFQLNGNRIPVAADHDGDSRALSFEILPTEMVEAIVLSKTFLPNMEGDAIGGSVNFLTKTAPESRISAVEIAGGYNALAQAPIVSGSFLYGNRFACGKGGFLVNGSFHQRDWAADNYRVFYGGNINHGLGRYELNRLTGQRRTIGLNWSAEYIFNDQHQIFLKGLYTNFRDDEHHRKLAFVYRSGQIDLQNIRGIQERQLGGGEIGWNWSNGKHQLELKAASYLHIFRQGPIPFKGNDPRNGEFVVSFHLMTPTTFDDIVFVGTDELFKFLGEDQIGFFPAVLDSLINPIDLERYIYYRRADTTRTVGIGDHYDNIQPDYPGDLGPQHFEFDRAYTELNKAEEKDPIVAQLDYSYDFSRQLKISAGTKFRAKNGFHNKGLRIWSLDINDQASSAPILLEDLETTPFNEDRSFLQKFGSNYDDLPFTFLTRNQTDDFIAQFSDRLTENKALTLEDIRANVGGNHSYEENVFAAYVMGRFQIADLTITTGVRAEYTFVEVIGDTLIGFDFDPNQGLIEPLADQSTVDNRYWSLFPSLNIVYRPKANTNYRLAFSRSMRRPNFDENKPGSPEVQFTNLVYTFGNPNIQPTYSLNFDLGAEFYFDKANYFSINAFYKYITDHVFETNLPFIPQGGNSSIALFRSFENAGNSWVTGIELAYRQQFIQLPGFLKGFGIDMDLAIIQSEMNLPLRTIRQQLPLQSPFLGNLILFYDHAGLEISLGLTYSAPFLEEVNTYQEPGSDFFFHNNTDYDIFQAGLWGLDTGASYQIGDHWTIFLEAENLVNAAERSYRGIRRHPLMTELYGIKGQLGLAFEW